VTAHMGRPVTGEVHEPCRFLHVPVTAHTARNLTAELAHQFDKILCMTEAHRNAVLKLAPGAAAKTQCLDPNGDVEDPIGKSSVAYLNCARRLSNLISVRLDEVSFGDVQEANPGRKVALPHCYHSSGFSN